MRKSSRFWAWIRCRSGFAWKCDPETFAELCERDGIRPAPYVGRYKWVMLDRLNAVGENELEELIRASYEMVSVKSGGKRPGNARGKKKIKNKSVNRKGR